MHSTRSYIAPNASISVKSAPKLLAAGVLPQTPLGQHTALTLLPRLLSWLREVEREGLRGEE